MKRLILVLLLIQSLVALSQNEAAIWYFGENAGLDFNSGTPVVLTDGELNTLEGCSTISDSSGNLLFYTDGVTVWDRNHNIMPNGTGLLGNTSTTQAAIIVPRPNSLNQYYIFTVDQRNGFFSALSVDGINYSTVDLTLNGGFGDIVSSEKNVPLVNQAYEKITAVQHADNNSFWIITFIQDRFLSWRVTATGVNTTPVISNVSFADDSRGYLKISPDGTKIACANFGPAPDTSLMLYDFNTTTGAVSNEVQLALEDPDDIPYGVEFSTQSQKLYVTTCKLNVTVHIPPSKLFQFNMLSADIPASRVLIHTSNVNTRGAVQLAIDGKIYRALSEDVQIGTPFLGIINDPEADGLACNYVHNALDISAGDPNRNVVEGLPPFMQSYFLLPSITASDVCFGDTTQFNLHAVTPPDSVNWDFGDPSTGVNNTSTLENPTHIFSSSGVFTITATVDIGGVITVLTIDITIFDLPVVTSPVTLIQCDDDLGGIVDFNLQEANVLISTNYLNETFTYYTSLLAAENADATFLIANPTAFSNATATTVWVRIENATNCFATAEVILQVISTNIPSGLMLIFEECDNDTDGDDANGITTFDFSNATAQILDALLPETNLTVAYYQNIPDALAEINSIDATNYTNTTANSQQLVVRVDNLMNTCFGLGFHITLNVNTVPEFDLLNSVSLCLNSQNPSVSIENPIDIYEYVWRNELGTIIGNTPEITIDFEGIYSVTATDTNGNNCEKTKSIQVNSMPTTLLLNFDINNIQITDNSSNNTITVVTTNLPNGNYEFALDSEDFQESNIFENVPAGIYTVRIREIENCLEASVEVSLIGIPNFFTPNNDGFNDTWHVTGIEFQPNSNVYIFDRFGKLIIILNPLGLGWNGFYKGNPLPSTDYWYKVELDDGRILKGHFSLIRK